MYREFQRLGGQMIGNVENLIYFFDINKMLKYYFSLYSEFNNKMLTFKGIPRPLIFLCEVAK